MIEPTQNRTAIFVSSDGARHDLEPDTEAVALAAIEAIKNSTGCTTPLEHFVENILRSYSYRSLSVSSIETELQELRENLAALENDFKTFARRYRPMLDEAIKEVEEAA